MCHLGIMCRAGRHRSEAVGEWFCIFLQECGFGVGIRRFHLRNEFTKEQWERFAELYASDPQVETWDDRGECGCRPGLQSDQVGLSDSKSPESHVVPGKGTTHSRSKGRRRIDQQRPVCK